MQGILQDILPRLEQKASGEKDTTCVSCLVEALPENLHLRRRNTILGGPVIVMQRCVVEIERTKTELHIVDNRLGLSMAAVCHLSSGLMQDECKPCTQLPTQQIGVFAQPAIFTYSCCNIAGAVPG